MIHEYKEAKQQWTIKYSSIEVARQVIEYSDVTMNNKVQTRSQNTEDLCKDEQ